MSGHSICLLLGFLERRRRRLWPREEFLSCVEGRAEVYWLVFEENQRWQTKMRGKMGTGRTPLL